jgi:hypothetical protein
MGTENIFYPKIFKLCLELIYILCDKCEMKIHVTMILYA